MRYFEVVGKKLVGKSSFVDIFNKTQARLLFGKTSRKKSSRGLARGLGGVWSSRMLTNFKKNQRIRREFICQKFHNILASTIHIFS